MTISLKINKYQDPHNEALKNISATFKKEWLTSYDYKKTEASLLSKSKSTWTTFYRPNYKTNYQDLDSLIVSQKLKWLKLKKIYSLFTNCSQLSQKKESS